MAATLIETPGGERLVVLPEADYLRLVASAKDRAAPPPAEAVPAEYANRIFAGESPVRVYRGWRGLTAKALAAAAGISAGHLSDIEHGRRDASADLRDRLAAALGLTADDLVPARMD